MNDRDTREPGRRWVAILEERDGNPAAKVILSSRDPKVARVVAGVLHDHAVGRPIEGTTGPRAPFGVPA